MSKLSYRPLIFTSYKDFLKKKRGYVTSLPPCLIFRMIFEEKYLSRYILFPHSEKYLSRYMLLVACTSILDNMGFAIV